ncbi:hypothetical protein [Granulicella arctica]|uniref:hypothetical protein n=1 Tax=Granulicella arctica TaxID=940613 RepID=UPI0021E01670|nr:hypothetical protein [Granulicella arctica]
MSHQNVHVRELAGWGFDTSEYRPACESGKVERACEQVALRKAYQLLDIIVPDVNERFIPLLDHHSSRLDLREEMAGLDWTLGVVDIRSLLAFQRRIFFSSKRVLDAVPKHDDESALVQFSFADPRPVTYDLKREKDNTRYLLQTDDPNVHFRPSSNKLSPLVVHGGSPFFEVAQYRERWFLRDGYHRAFALMQAGVYILPAVIVRARTLEELGATQPWFFPEAILLSQSPPLVADFLDNSLVLEYDRPRLIKKLCVTIEETFVPFTL